MTTPPDAHEPAVPPVHTHLHGGRTTWELTNVEAESGHGATLWFSNEHTPFLGSGSQVSVPGPFTSAGLVPDDDRYVSAARRAIIDALADTLGGGGLSLAQTRHALRGALTRLQARLAPTTSREPAPHTHAHVLDLARVAAIYDLPDAAARTVGLAIFNAGGFDGTPEELVTLATTANTPPERA